MVTRSINRHVIALMVGCAVPAAAQTNGGKGTLVGFVIATPGDAPVRGAAVQLDTTSWRTVADSQGRFELDSVDPGTYVLHIRAIGYDEGAWRVRLHSDRVTTHAFALAQQVVELPGVAVKSGLPLSARRYIDFERRRHMASGAFFTQEDIEKVNPSTLVDILVTVRGVQQVCLVNDCVAKMVRSPPGCYPQYYIDGIESTAYFARHTPPQGHQGHRDLSRVVGDPGRVRGLQLGLRRHRHLDQVLSIILALALLAGCRPSATSERPPAATPGWLLDRWVAESTLAARSTVPHDFHFAERREQSGITFVNRIVDDAGKTYKKVHYDHGTGVCATDEYLYFVTQRGTNELWRNSGKGRFENITDAAGLRMPDAIAVACAFADIDNDGLPDLFVTTVRHGNHLFKNMGNGRFSDITQSAGVGYVGHSSGAVFFDYDGDGLVDLFVANVGRYTNDSVGAGGYYIGLVDAFHGHTHPDRAEASILYHNLGNDRFQDVSKATGLVDLSWSGDATVIDANDDGWPDLYVLDMQGRNHLWLNEGGKRFLDSTKAYFPRTPYGAMGVKVFDFNGDGRPDLFITDMHSDMWVNIPVGFWDAEVEKVDSAEAPAEYFPEGKAPFIFGNALYANLGGGKFQEVSDSLGVENYWPWGPSVDDINADGWDDIFIASSMNFPHRYGINSLLLNEAGRHFLPSEFTTGVEPRPNGDTAQVWFTLECQGGDRANPLCQACAEAGANIGCRRGAEGHDTVMGALGSRSAVLLDIDGDGDLDIVTNEFNAPPQVLVSDLAQRHRIHWLNVRLRGTHSNREGLGARVTVILPSGRRLLKVMDGKSGYLSQSDLPLYFGLGDADHADSLAVRWPSGKQQTVAGPLPSGRPVEVTEP